MNLLTRSLIAGIIITLGLFGLAWLAALKGWLNFSYFLYWQGWVLQMPIPCAESEIPGLNLPCHQTEWHFYAFYAGLPLGVIVYGALAWLGLRLQKRGPR